MVLGVGKGVLFGEVSSVQQCPHREREVPLYHELSLPSLPSLSSPHQTDDNQKHVTPLIVKNLISLTHGTTHTHLTSLSHMMALLIKGDHIPAPVVKLLWDIFTKRYAKFMTTVCHSFAMLYIQHDTVFIQVYHTMYMSVYC